MRVTSGKSRVRESRLLRIWEGEAEWPSYSTDVLDAGVPCAWVLGDEVYGTDRRLRVMLEGRGKPYLLAIRSNDKLWSELGGSVGQHEPALLARALPPQAWRLLSAGAGSKGERLFDWARVRLRDRTAELQQHRASGLALVTAAIALWNTVYLGRAVDALRCRGEIVPDGLLTHLAPSAGSTSTSPAIICGALMPASVRTGSGRSEACQPPRLAEPPHRRAHGPGRDACYPARPMARPRTG